MRPSTHRNEFTTLSEIESALETKLRRGKFYAWIGIASGIASLYPIRKMHTCAAAASETIHEVESLRAIAEGLLYGMAAFVILLVIPLCLCPFIPTKIERSLLRILKTKAQNEERA